MNKQIKRLSRTLVFAVVLFFVALMPLRASAMEESEASVPTSTVEESQNNEEEAELSEQTESSEESSAEVSEETPPNVEESVPTEESSPVEESAPTEEAVTGEEEFKPPHPTLSPDRFLPNSGDEDVVPDVRLFLARAGSSAEKFNHGALMTLQQTGGGRQYRELVAFYNQYTNTKQKMAEIQALAKQLTAGVSSEDQKALILHNWVSGNIAYDMDAFYSPRQQDYDIASDAIQTYILRRGMCVGYAQLYILMCGSVGVQTEFIGGYAGENSNDAIRSWSNHAWVTVRVNGSWHFSDPTWDSPHTYQNGKRTSNGGVTTKYHKPTTQSFSRDHKSFFYGYTFNNRIEEQELPDNGQLAQFVTRFYQLVLQREPDPNGLQAWSSRLASGNSSGAEVADGFLGSVEMTRRNLSNKDFVSILYRSILGREPDPNGMRGWVNHLEAGMPRRWLYSNFVEGKEFARLCQQYGIRVGKVNLTRNSEKNMGVTKFVARLYRQTLGRQEDPNGLDHWTGEVIKGRDIMSIAKGFVFSKELISQNLSDAEFVRVMYRAFLGREADPKGLQNWINHLKRGRTREFIMEEFVKSKEFQGIRRSFGIQ